jgi:hypothetical protein
MPDDSFRDGAGETLPRRGIGQSYRNARPAIDRRRDHVRLIDARPCLLRRAIEAVAGRTLHSVAELIAFSRLLNLLGD